VYLQYITGCLCNCCEVRISPALCDVFRSLYTGTAARGSTWPTYGGRPCVPASRARPSRPSLSSLPSETPSRAGLAASSADSNGAVLTYATHILQHHWHLCRPQAAFSPFARSHRNVRTRCTHEEWQYCVLIPEEIREVMHCRRKSWFQLMTDVTQTRECVSVEYGVLAYCTHAMHAGGRKASTGTPLQRSGALAATPKDGRNLINATSANEGKTVLAAADIRVRRHPDLSRVSVRSALLSLRRLWLTFILVLVFGRPSSLNSKQPSHEPSQPSMCIFPARGQPSRSRLDAADSSPTNFSQPASF
jgi:hypothetical protein